MAECPHGDGCELYPLFRLRASLETWRIRYCEADYTGCVRYQRREAGHEIPAQLLPNGRMLPVLKKDG